MAESLPVFPVNVQRLTDSGRDLELAADASQRVAIAAHAGVTRIDDLRAELSIRPYGRDGAALLGTLHAELEQPCVVTTEPVGQVVDAPIDLRFLPREHALSGDGEIIVEVDGEDPPDFFDGAAIDVWAAVIETLILEIDPFPRAAGAQLDPAAEADDGDDEREESPFAALEALKSSKNQQG